jgi:hypothetical protein
MPLKGNTLAIDVLIIAHLSTALKISIIKGDKEMEKLNENIKKFLDVYRFLPSEAKAAFEAQITSHINSCDQKTKNLYAALLSSAKENLDPADTIERMKKINPEQQKQ